METEEMQKIVDDLVQLSERKNLNKQLKESAGKAAEFLSDIINGRLAVMDWLENAELKTCPPEPELPADSAQVVLTIPNLPKETVIMDKCSAEKLAAAFSQRNRPIFACNLPAGGLWEVDLQKVAIITSDGLELPESKEEPQSQERNKRPVPSYKNRSRENGWRRGNVTCHNCGADYETDINEKWSFVRCKYCHETNTTVTYDDD